MTDEPFKKCSKCGEVKALSEFYKVTRNKDGLNEQCRNCVSKRGKKWRSDEKNRLKEIERCKKWRSENISKIYEYNDKWKSENPERHKEIRRKASSKQKKNLSDSYIASQLNIPVAECTQELIELKREQLRIHRLTKQLKKEIQND